YEVVTASSGFEGLRKAEGENPDLIVLDIMMPGLDGITVLEKLKINEKTRNIPVILISVAENKKSLGLKLGALAFFKKPLDFNRLDKKIKKITKKKSILIVDDNPALLKLLKMKFNSIGYDTRCAYNEHSAFEKIKEKRPHLILMDVVLHGESGLEIIQKIKAKKDFADIPIIAFSGFLSEEVPDDKIVGVERFFSRHFSVQDLAGEVNKIAGKKEKVH
ncbi:MAG: response regulator, partial [Elusimicrobiota bacterium]